MQPMNSANGYLSTPSPFVFTRFTEKAELPSQYTPGQGKTGAMFHKELNMENEVKEKKYSDLTLCHEIPIRKGTGKGRTEDKLMVANEELILQNIEKEKRAGELLIINEELRKAREYQEDYIDGLKEMMFMTSHKVRQPIANILGLSNLLGRYINSPDDLKKLVTYMQESASVLNAFTVELTERMRDLAEKEKKKYME
jgi:hypothetical protein